MTNEGVLLTHLGKTALVSLAKRPTSFLLPECVGPMAILIVDDDEDVRLVMEHVLIDAGYEVDTTGTASGGHKLLQDRSYDLVIADGKLPDGTGMEIADEALEKGSKVLVITGYAFTLPLKMRGRYEILLKPLRPNELVTAVAQVLRA